MANTDEQHSSVEDNDPSGDGLDERDEESDWLVRDEPAPRIIHLVWASKMITTIAVMLSIALAMAFWLLWQLTAKESEALKTCSHVTGATLVFSLALLVCLYVALKKFNEKLDDSEPPVRETMALRAIIVLSCAIVVTDCVCIVMT